MKTFLILSILSFVGLSLAKPGRGQRPCEVGTHRYNTGCGYLKPEPTCDNPNPKTDTTGKICDFSACYCDPPTVRNKMTGKCVSLDECPIIFSEE